MTKILIIESNNNIGYYKENTRFLHREDGPACINYNNWDYCYIAYHINNRWHRLDGPARIRYNDHKKIYSIEYWTKGYPSAESIFYIKVAK